MGGIDIGDLVGDYINEAEQLIARMNELILKLCERYESGAIEQMELSELLSELFRSAHTLKGSSGFIGLRCIEELAHSMEEVFDELRFGGMALSDELIEALLQSVDALELSILQLKSGAQPDEELLKSVTEWFSRMAVVSREHPVEEAADESPIPEHIRKVLTAYQEKLALECLNLGLHIYEFFVPMNLRELERQVMVWKNKLMEFGRVIAVLPQTSSYGDYDIAFRFILASALDESEIALTASQAAGSAKRLVEAKVSAPKVIGTEISIAGDRETKGALAELKREREPLPAISAVRTIRVDVHKLDKLLNLVGELIVIRSRYLTLEKQLRNLLKGSRTLEEFERTNRFLCRRLDELREGIFEVRMIPLKFVFARAPRLVRELARASGKQVRLMIDGEDVEMDRAIVEAISEPLMHLLRNAVDHGIELPDERQHAGKEAVGNIWLTARREGNRITIEVKDDGRGIDVVKVAKRARALSVEIHREDLTNEELLEVLCQPGFSTSEHVTHLSGRGVGLDAVKNSVESMGGTVELETTVGFGTTFRMRLPVTVAILQVLLTRIGKALCAFPTDAVIGALNLRSRCVVKIGGVEAYKLNGDIIPLLRMSELFSRPVADQLKMFIVLLEAHGMRAGVVVNELIGLQDIVIKPLPAPLSGIDILIGAAELGDGSIAVIVDAHKLIMRLFKYIRMSGVKLKDTSVEIFEEAYERLYALAFQIADKMFAMPIEQVAEVLRGCELLRFPKMPQSIEGVIEWQGRRIPVIDLRKLLGIGTPKWDEKTRLIVTNINGMCAAVVVDTVIDVVSIKRGDIQPLPGMAGIKGVAKCKIGNTEVECILIDINACIKLQDYPIVLSRD
ncbi:MAG: chemotaxis protein CheA [Armatimonadota bacterium]|nr:chemotaxis protein CheW [Armatimonadota bacterium]MCX7778083.1 chemotaxis protein CheW [Armatimonadota bacterium]MDW8025470.1 chemotaxis protein CheA [Armatimonadota bacterium]